LIHPTFTDDLAPAVTPGMPDRFFDRFMFNLHPADASSPSVILGLGVYPPRGLVDGFALLVTGSEQRNLRFSTELSALPAPSGAGISTAGPVSWQVLEPMAAWRLVLAPNRAGLEFDVTWRARTAAWVGEVRVANNDGTPSAFEHLVQSGLYQGTLRIDGQEHEVTGWYGQRDRSRGVRTMSGGQGLHIWYQAQFPDRCIGFLLVETRQHERMLLEGAVMHTTGELDDIVDVRHDLSFTDGLDLRGGRVEVRTAAGAVYRVDADASAGGGFMAGAGYGGQHGRPMGLDHVEHDVYPLDGSVSPRTLDSALTDRLTAFTWDGTPGRGIFEFALTRSSSYAYRPSLR
jgi:hypothetical protein